MGDQRNFTEDFIDAYSRGQEARTKKRLEENAQEDRDIEKQLLQHRLKAIKINEKVLARKGAMENADLMEGQPEANFPWDGQQQRQAPSALGPGFGTMEVPKRGPSPVNIPGIEELGVPGTTAQPRSLEEVLRQLSMEVRTKARGMSHELSGDESVVIPGPTDADPMETYFGRPRTFAPRNQAAQRSVGRRRDPNGTYYEWDEFYDPQTGQTRKSAERVVQPRASGGGAVNAEGGTPTMLSKTEQDAAVRMFMKGAPLDLNPKSAIGLRNYMALDRAGMDIPTVVADQTTYANYLKQLGSDDKRREVVEAAGAISEALGNMDRLLDDPKATDEEVDNWADVIRAYAPVIKPGGSKGTAAEIAKAEEFFQPGILRRWRGNKAEYKPMMDKLRIHLGVRLQSIHGASTFQPVGSEQGPSAPPRPGRSGSTVIEQPEQPDPNDIPPLGDSVPGDLSGERTLKTPQRIQPQFTDAQIAAALVANGRRGTLANVEAAKKSQKMMDYLFPRK